MTSLYTDYNRWRRMESLQFTASENYSVLHQTRDMRVPFFFFNIRFLSLANMTHF